MRLFAIVALLVVLSSVGAAQDRTKAEAEYIQRCKLKATTHAVRGKSPEFHFRKGEKYEHSPIIAYEILESGEIAHAFVKRSSGVADLDHYALKWVQEFKYNNRPGCGIVESQVVVNIDFARP
jgi:TonB family protein